MFVFIGLGNPGAQYEQTRHNVGFLALDALAQEHQVQFCLDKYHKSLSTKINIAGQNCLLLKPQTFMNLSGESLVRIKKDVPAQNIVILYDDLDLSFGRLRVKSKGSAGTHNGMKSIIAHLGTDKFPRIRIGIRPDHPIGNLKSFVLSNFRIQDIETMQSELFPSIIDCVHLIAKGELNQASQKYNKKEES